MCRYRGIFPVLAVLLAALVLPAGPAASWPAPPPDTNISPGDQVVTAGRTCTAGFVFTDRRHRTYVAYAASCALAKGSPAVNTCGAQSLPLGTKVTFRDRGRTIGTGRLDWSSAAEMQRAGVTDRARCGANDLALVRVVGRDRARTIPDPPYWGGPSRVAGLPVAGAMVFTVDRPTRRARALPRVARLVAVHQRSAVISARGTHRAVRGAGLVDGRGRAVGIVSRVADGRQVVTGLAAATAWARSHGVPGLRLVPGTEPFEAVVVL